MFIVAIHWKIKPDKTDEFLRFWKEQAFIHDRTGLVGEFLTKPLTNTDYDWITWDLLGDESKYKSFINVGYWESAEKFHEQVGQYFKKTPEDFEYELRVRTALDPRHWRMGDASLPKSSSEGVR